MTDKKTKADPSSSFFCYHSVCLHRSGECSCTGTVVCRVTLNMDKNSMGFRVSGTPYALVVMKKILSDHLTALERASLTASL